MRSKRSTIPNYTYEQTNDKNLYRFIDREGNWTHYWIKSKKQFVPAVNHIIRVGYPKGERFYAYLLGTNPHEAERRLRTAGEEGTRTHAAIRDLIDGKKIDLATRYYNELSERYEPLTIDEWFNIESFNSWVDKYKPELFVQEYSLWSEEYLFAGTADFIGSILVPENDKCISRNHWGKRILILLDWKTSGGIWEEYELQTAAYRKVAIERLGKKLDPLRYGALWTGIVRLGTTHKAGFEMKVWDAEMSEVNFELFQSARDIYDRKAGDPFEPEIKQIPAEFEIAIPRMPALRSRSKTKTSKKKAQTDKIKNPHASSEARGR